MPFLEWGKPHGPTHDHDYDPSCREYRLANGAIRGECILTGKEADGATLMSYWDKAFSPAYVFDSDAGEYRIPPGLDAWTHMRDLGKVAEKGALDREMVDHPPHYGGEDNPYEVIKVAEAWGLDKDAYLFNVLKYIGRAGKKGPELEDLKKAQWYMNRRVARQEDS